MDAETSKGFEIKCGLTIAMFAAVLAVSELFSGKYGDDEIKAINEKSSAYMWYQSKSIKETILEGQQALLQSLLEAQAIEASHSEAIQTQISALSQQVKKYALEKKEILLGSANVGRENWVQEVNGEHGKVIGAQEYMHLADKMGETGDRLDLSTLFLQLCLVLGAVSIVVQNRKVQLAFYTMMCTLGGIGTAISVYALVNAP